MGVVRMRRMVGIILSLALACGLLLDAGCVRSPSNQPTTITIWHVYGGQTDSPLNDLIDVFNNTVGVEEGIRVEVAMVSDNKNIHNGIIAAAAGEPGSPKLPDMFVSYPKTVLALPDVYKRQLSGYAIRIPVTRGSLITLYAVVSVSYTHLDVYKRQVFPFILIGVAVGALIHNWIPQDIIEAVLGDGNPLAVVLATLIGAPIYADIFGTIPIAEALFQKGVGLGTILAFMMSVTVLSIPSLTMLSRVVKPKLLAAFVGICLVGMIISGYVFNWLQPLFV